MKFPIDTSSILFAIAIPGVVVTDFRTKEIRKNADGHILHAVHLMAMDGVDSYLIKISLPYDPQLPAGQLVTVKGLAYQLAKAGEMRWWSAESVEPIGPRLPTPGTPASVPPAPPASPGPASASGPPGQTAQTQTRRRSPIEGAQTPGGEG
ncbi:hypothetical protein [Streptosporangium jomthongense]|uniref:Uncharacterized protein n=1 Tax=Streptosporangium jomthongense TaxID=1193683 RepID=A0ABV8FAS3_9ACTN